MSNNKSKGLPVRQSLLYNISMIFGTTNIIAGIVAMDKSVVNPTACEAYDGEIEYIEPNMVATAAEGMAAAIVQKIIVLLSKFIKAIVAQTKSGITTSFMADRK